MTHRRQQPADTTRVVLHYSDGVYSWSTDDVVRAEAHGLTVVDVPDAVLALWRAVGEAYRVMQGQLRVADDAWLEANQ